MLTRRSFLKLVGVSAVAVVIVPAIQFGRNPYVLAGEVVDFVGPRPGGFIGGCVVAEVHPWDGHGYPVEVWNNAFGVHRKKVRFYDADLAAMRREVPAKFWHDPANRKWPNVHTWIRAQRFGESMEEAARHLNFYSSRIA